MAEQKMVYLAEDGEEFDTPEAADAHSEVIAIREHIEAFADYHAAMLGKSSIYAARFADVLEEYEMSKSTGVPEVPKDIIKRNEQKAAELKAKRDAKKAEGKKKAA